MLTALDEEIDQIVGIEIGADDYIAKPVSPRFLLCRINAILRLAARSGKCSNTCDSIRQTESPSDEIVIGNLTVHLPSRNVFVKSAPIDLTTSQFDFLKYLAAHAGEIISRDRLFQDLRRIEYDGLNRSI